MYYLIDARCRLIATVRTEQQTNQGQNNQENEHPFQTQLQLLCDRDNCSLINITASSTCITCSDLGIAEGK